MARLFDVSTENIGQHMKDLYEDGKLVLAASTEEFSVVQTEGGRSSIAEEPSVIQPARWTEKALPA